MLDSKNSNIERKVVVALIAYLWLAVGACLHEALANGFEVRPVTVEVSGVLGAVTVYNPGHRRIYIETTIYAWSKDAVGKDVLTESSDAVASPPAMWVPPQSSYLVRLKFPFASSTRELPFRVQLQQIPDRSDIAGGRVVFMITQNLAAFSEPPSPAPPKLSASLIGQALVLENGGGKRARLQGIWQDGNELAHGLLGYVLAGTSLRLNVPVHPGGIVVETDVGKVNLTVR